MDFPLSREINGKSVRFTHREELEQIKKTAASLPVVPEKMLRDIALLEPKPVPVHVMYMLGHFWELWGMCGEDMTIHDVVVYQKTFAPAMQKFDMLVLMRVHRHALAFIRKMEDDVKKKPADTPLRGDTP